MPGAEVDQAEAVRAEVHDDVLVLKKKISNLEAFFKKKGGEAAFRFPTFFSNLLVCEGREEKADVSYLAFFSLSLFLAIASLSLLFLLLQIAFFLQSPASGHVMRV